MAGSDDPGPGEFGTALKTLIVPVGLALAAIGSVLYWLFHR